MSTLRPLVAWPSKSPTCGAGSTELTRQSTSPTEDNEKRPSSGGVILARATLTVDDRSVPYHGLARAPLTGLRVVATRRVGRSEISDASNRGAFAAMPAQPATASAQAADAAPRS